MASCDCLQAMFEVIATEDSYVRSLDVLVKHFMEDPGMNPDLPEGRRVLNRRQYHVIFSNVREVHEVAKRYDVITNASPSCLINCP